MSNGFHSNSNPFPLLSVGEDTVSMGFKPFLILTLKIERGIVDVWVLLLL